METFQLLKLAAKAIDLDYDIVRLAPRANPIIQLITVINGERIEWNPLKDNLQAFNLLIELGQRYGIQLTLTANGCSSCDVFAFNRCNTFEEDANDPFSAARRVIVQSAAELGKRL